MPLSGLDVTGVSRSLSQIADQPDDLVDTYFERLEEVELPPADEELGLRVRREEGFAIRLLRSSQMRLGYENSRILDDEVEHQDELDPDLLQNVALAGARFDWMLKRLREARPDSSTEGA